jgi:hypothetical protein
VFVVVSQMTKFCYKQATEDRATAKKMIENINIFLTKQKLKETFFLFANNMSTGEQQTTRKSISNC